MKQNTLPTYIYTLVPIQVDIYGCVCVCVYRERERDKREVIYVWIQLIFNKGVKIIVFSTNVTKKIGYLYENKDEHKPYLMPHKMDCKLNVIILNLLD